MADALEPVTPQASGGERAPEPGIGLAVSGGGYRGMLFHLGAFLRLFELGLLKGPNGLQRVSSVSSGSITSAKIALEWDKLSDRDAFLRHVVPPVRALARVTIDAPAIVGGMLLPGTAADRMSRIFTEFLFGAATLQDMPDEPRFVINATNLETGSLWRFMKPYMGDYKVGRVDRPTTSLADAVTASSAFPPVLSPFILDVEAEDFTEVEPGLDPSFLQEIALTDGGVYDNLGLETVWRRYRTVLVSDAGEALTSDASPPGDWARQAKRAIEIIHGQVSSVRKRQLMASFEDGRRSGAYWGIRTDIAHYGLADALHAPRERTQELAGTPTRFKRLGGGLQERLINWGYAVCDAAMRKHAPPQGAAGSPRYPFPIGV